MSVVGRWTARAVQHAVVEIAVSEGVSDGVPIREGQRTCAQQSEDDSESGRHRHEVVVEVLRRWKHRKMNAAARM